MRKELLLMSIFVSLFSTFAMGQSEEKNIPVQKLNETVITTTEAFGTKTRETAKNIQVITADEIKLRGASTVQEALKGIPGVIVRKYDGGMANIDLRGSGDAVSFSGTTLLLDGVPMNGLVKLDINSIAIDDIDRIEIIQGGGAVVYGDGSTGGVVNIITKAAQNKTNYGSINLELASWKTKKANLTYGTNLTDKFSVAASYSNTSSMEYRERGYGTDYYGEKFDYRNRKDEKESIMLRTKYELKDGAIDLRYSHTENIDIYTGYLEKKEFDKNPRQKGQYSGLIENKIDIWNLSFNKKLTDKFDFLVYGGYSKDKSINQKQETKEYFIKPELKYNYAKDSYIIVGGDYRKGEREFKEILDVNGVLGKAPNDERKSKAIYLLNKTSFGNFQFTQGYRREKVEYKYSEKKYNSMTWALEKIVPKGNDYSNNNSFELGINYLYSSTGNTYFNYTRATRTPTIGEAGAWHGEYKTQKNDIFEIGLRDYYKNTFINTSIFYINSENEVYYDKTDPNYSKNRNFDGKVRRTGAQLSLIHDFNKLTLRENISYINPKVKTGQYKGKEFAGVPKWIFNLGATYKFTDKFLINADMYYQSKAYAVDDFDNYHGRGNDYLTVDTNISYSFDNGLEIYGGIKNLFDEKYASSITSTRTSWGAGARKIYYPADGRSFYTGFRYKF